MNNLSFFIIVILLVNSVFTKSIIDFDTKGPKEGYYLVNIKNSQSKKRQLIDDNVKEAISEIHNLIVDNIDTYKNVTILEELEEINELRKRTEEESSDSPYVYPIAENEEDEETILNAYVTKELLESIAGLPNVSHIESVHGYKEEAIYNTSDILSQTKWKKLTVKSKAKNELSIISQGHYIKSIIDKYDTTYYTPSTNGKGIDIYIIEKSFDFTFDEFSNTDRTAKCVLTVANGKATKVSKKTCMDYIDDYHGTIVAAAVGGKTVGAARSANIYGIALQKLESNNEIAALNYIKNNMTSGKTIVNFSFGEYYSKSYIESNFKNEINLIKTMAGQGVVFVASSGNDSFELFNTFNTNNNHVPSQFANVISVGGADITSLNAPKLHQKSNYGKGVDIYAPITVQFPVGDTSVAVTGTSISAAYVTGVSALVIGEFSGSYNSTSMLTKLKSLATGIMTFPANSNSNNYFLNNGKRIVYSLSGTYKNSGCGLVAGNISCGSNKCCTSSHKCVAKSTTDAQCKASNGCQSSYGYCAK